MSRSRPTTGCRRSTVHVDGGVAAGEGADEPLELADVALEAGAQREAVGVVLGEERRRGRLRAVDGRRAAHDDRAQGRQAAADRQQLQRADDVDVVERRARAAGLGELDDVVVDDGVDRGRAHRGGQLGAAQVGRDHVDALGERGVDRARVDADDALDAGVGGEPAREPRAERVGHAGDQDAPAGHASPCAQVEDAGGGRPALWPAGAGRRGAPARGGAGRLELLDARLERGDALAQRGELVGPRTGAAPRASRGSARRRSPARRRAAARARA